MSLISLQAEEKNTSEEAAQQPDAKRQSEEDDNKTAPAEPPKKTCEPQRVYMPLVLQYYSSYLSNFFLNTFTGFCPNQQHSKKWNLNRKMNPLTRRKMISP